MPPNSKFVDISATSPGRSSSEDYIVGTYKHLPSSRERKQNLEAYATQLAGGADITIRFDSDASTASIRNYDNTDDDKQAIITIPTDADVENPFDKIDDDTFYSILQYSWVLHEVGHYLYSDYPTAKKRGNQYQEYVRKNYNGPIAAKLTQVGKHLWNIFEDGAMEESIRRSKGPRAAQRLAVKNQTFIASGGSDLPDFLKDILNDNIKAGDATGHAAMDLAKYDTGRLRRYFDDTDTTYSFTDDEHEDFFFNTALPLIETAVQETQTEPDPITRQHRIWDHVETIADVLGEFWEDHFDQDDQSGQQSASTDLDNDFGQAQQQASGLEQASKQEIAQRQANTEQQSVSVSQPEPSTDSDEENQEDSPDSNEDGSAGEDSNEPSDDTESSDSTDSNGSDRNDDSTDTASTSGGENTNDEQRCPNCNSTNIEDRTEYVDGEIAARAQPPFDPHANWVESVTFVSNNELYGFRVRGDINAAPISSIENNGQYKAVEIDASTIEILEPANRYGDNEPVKGYVCTDCDASWIPTIGGDNQ